MDLRQSLNQAYAISAFALKPFGPVWQVKSVQGTFALKRTGSPVERLIRTAETLAQIKQAGFVSLIVPEITKGNLPYFKYNSHYYQLFQWRQGDHPSFSDPGSIQKSARLFGSLHLTSLALTKPGGYEIPDLIANLKQRLSFLEKSVSFLENKSRLNRVDRGILGWSDYFLTQARYCLFGLTNVSQGLFSNALAGFCHNDPAPRNIIIEGDQWFLIDFELSGCGLFVTELAKLTERILQANNWRTDIFDLVVEAYSRERAITGWERTVLPYLLCFPQHFWRICSQRWEEKLKWSQRRFAAKYWRITNGEKLRLNFLKSIFPDLFD